MSKFSPIHVDENRPIRQEWEPTADDYAEAYMYLNEVHFIPAYAVEFEAWALAERGLTMSKRVFPLLSAPLTYWDEIDRMIASRDSSPV